ncbi:P-loop NTPase family protein [Exiguobacterium chiriqhucha]|uniref:ATP-binding protein n=1 Tax=Exiguobacterium chiriqhucha TaxID=1385984 RepID=UPI0038B9E077
MSVSVEFIIKPIANYLLKEAGYNYWERIKIKFKIKKIKEFRREYDNSFVDSNSFQKTLDSEEVYTLIYKSIFDSKYYGISREDLVEQLSKIAIDNINEYRKDSGISFIKTHPDIENYFKDLLIYLERIRDKIFSEKERSMLANIQNSIVDNNEQLKKYFELYLYEIQQRQHLKIFTHERLNRDLTRSINNLSKRYIPESNIEIDIEKYLTVMMWDQSYIEEIQELFNELKKSIMELNEFKLKNEMKLKEVDLTSLLDVNLVSFCEEEIREQKISKNRMDMVSKKIGLIEDEIFEIIKVCEMQRNEINIEGFTTKLINISRLMRNINENLGPLQQNLLVDPYLLIHGEGGIGKSHLLASNAEKYYKKGHEVFLFLGQQFTSNEDPFIQIFKELDFRGERDAFLKEFNERAIYSGKKTIIIIDALNEGDGKYFWKSHILNFLNKIKEYPNIAVIFSVRSNYISSIFPNELEFNFPLSLLKHPGFSNLTLENIQPLFEYYNIDWVTFPTFDFEARNPLFLHIYCEISRDEQEVHRGWSIFEVLSKYIMKINRKTASDQRFQYPQDLNLIDVILKTITKSLLENKSSSISLPELYSSIEEAATTYVKDHRYLVNALIEENIITVSKGYDGKEIAFFTYERFADLYNAIVMIDHDNEEAGYIKDVLETDDPYYYGVIEALSIVLPETKGIELLDYMEDNINFNLIEGFIRGLSWRNVNTFDSKMKKWVVECLSIDNECLLNLLYEQLLKQSYLIESPINSEFLYEHLNLLDMPERDKIWTKSINSNLDTPQQLVNFIVDENLTLKKLKKNNFTLIAITYPWLFSSTNIFLRDTATRALTKTFLYYPDLMQLVFEKFKKVNDPYILERILASSYGACLRLEDKALLLEFIENIYTTIFLNNSIKPNVLIRDYARGIVQMGINYEMITEIDQRLISPPYSSEWYTKKYSNEEIEKFLQEIRETNSTSYTGFDTIRASLDTDYGDFGRYILGSSLSNWSNQFNQKDLSNIALMEIYELGYRQEFHGEYDAAIRSFDRHQNSIERIGKKYQWIVLYELLARITDNFPIYKEVKIYSDEYKTYKEKLNLRILELLTQSESLNVDLGVLEEGVSEEELLEEDHVIEIDRVEGDQYNGPWELYLRNIDPTLVERVEDITPFSQITYLPDSPNKQWVESDEEINQMNIFLEFEYESNEYVSLGQMLSQEHKSNLGYSNNDSFFIKTKAVFIDSTSKNAYIEQKMKRESNLSVDWPHSYYVFAFEHYDLPASKNTYYINNYTDSDSDSDSVDALWEYIWERNTDYSLDEETNKSYLYPNKNIVDFFNLVQTREGIWKYNELIVAIDLKSLGHESNLLIRKDYLDIYLQKNEIAVVWDVYMEKKSNRLRKDQWYICWYEDKNRIEHKILKEYIYDIDDKF